MKKTIELSPRLAAVASMIPEHCGVCDVGTDHGYLPVYLALHGGFQRIVASDIRIGPLRNAEKSGEEWGVSDKIEYILSDGLKSVEKDGIGCVICAGMGGETVENILRETAWALDGSVSLVLQIQSKIERPLSLLAQSGFGVADAVLVKDNGRYYSVIRAEKGICGIVDTHTELGICRALLIKKDRLICEYIDALIRKNEAALAGQKMAREDHSEAEKTEEELRELYALRKESERADSK